MIENVYVRNIEVGQCKESVLKINMNYDTRETSNRGYMPTVRNVFLNNVNCKKSTYGVFIDALKDQYKIEPIIKDIVGPDRSFIRNYADYTYKFDQIQKGA